MNTATNKGDKRRSGYIDLNQKYKDKGTEFQLYPQAPSTNIGLETVWVSKANLRDGPSDDLLHVVSAKSKQPYGLSDTNYTELDRGKIADIESEFHRPPVAAKCRDKTKPAIPDDYGNFSYLANNMDQDVASADQFNAAHMYGVVRRVLDIWETYLKRELTADIKAFSKVSPSESDGRLELIPQVNALETNAQAGPGFIEAGVESDSEGKPTPMCRNFDVLAHETGHIILYATVGLPTDFTLTGEFLGFHESASDLIALVSVLHSESFATRLLKETNGNLYSLNELNRIGELIDNREIRLACNWLRMSNVPHISTPVDEIFASQPKRHELGQPLTGAFFDVLIEVYHRKLLEKGVIDENLYDLVKRDNERDSAHKTVSQLFARLYQDNSAAFLGALLEARDFVGTKLAKTWDALSPDNLSYYQVVSTFLAIDRDNPDSEWYLETLKYESAIHDIFSWREIGFDANFTLPTAGQETTIEQLEGVLVRGADNKLYILQTNELPDPATGAGNGEPPWQEVLGGLVKGIEQKFDEKEKVRIDNSKLHPLDGARQSVVSFRATMTSRIALASRHRFD